MSRKSFTFIASSGAVFFATVLIIRLLHGSKQKKWIYPKVIGHRGGGTLAPENTIPAMDKAKELGIRGVEFDVMLSKDKVPILMHDEILKRTIVSKEHEGKIFNELTADQLSKVDAGSWYDPKLIGISPPTFESIIKKCNDLGLWMNIEIKPITGFETETAEVVALTVTHYFPSSLPIQKLPLFSSFSFEALKHAKTVAPYIPRGFLVEDLSELPDWKAKMVELDVVAVHTDHKHLTQQLAREVKAEGYGLFCYTVNDVARAQLLESWGVDAFCTDKLDIFRNYT